VDLVVLNRAASPILSAALRGVRLLVRDRGLYVDLLLSSMAESEESREKRFSELLREQGGMISKSACRATSYPSCTRRWSPERRPSPTLAWGNTSRSPRSTSSHASGSAYAEQLLLVRKVRVDAAGITRMAFRPDKILRSHFHRTSACLGALYHSGRYEGIVDILRVDTIWPASAGP
jgi:hypothetical protein